MATELPYDLTPELAPLSWLIGSWEGQGRLGDGSAGTEILSLIHISEPTRQVR